MPEQRETAGVLPRTPVPAAPSGDCTQPPAALPKVNSHRGWSGLKQCRRCVVGKPESEAQQHARLTVRRQPGVHAGIEQLAKRVGGTQDRRRNRVAPAPVYDTGTRPGEVGAHREQYQLLDLGFNSSNRWLSAVEPAERFLHGRMNLDQRAEPTGVEHLRGHSRTGVTHLRRRNRSPRIARQTRGRDAGCARRSRGGQEILKTPDTSRRGSSRRRDRRDSPPMPRHGGTTA